MAMNDHSLIEYSATLEFRVDTFSVPEGARGEFQTAMLRNLAFLKTLPGFRGHLVLEKTGGPTAFNTVTIAAWESREALEKAAVEVGAYYRRIGFDPSAMIAQWGARAEIGTFHEAKAPPK
jgi:hypothetical protein